MCARKSFQILLLIFSVCLWLLPLEARADETDETLTLLGQTPPADPVAGRLPRQLSRTAENTSVITAAEIRALNAHTLVDILATVPGIQLENLTGSANLVFTRIQGSNFSHLLVLLDGIPYNNLGDNFADIGQIPARIIERVEIVKGAASSAWGQALGGVINVITKAPVAEQPLSGALAIAKGERSSSDNGGELSGSLSRLGYYLAGGNLHSAGLQPNTGFNANSAHGKLSWELPHQGEAGLLVNYVHQERGEFVYQPQNVQGRDATRRLILGLSLRQPFGSNLELQLNGFHSDNQIDIKNASLSSGQLFQKIDTDEQFSGGGLKLLWRQPGNLLISGIDYQHVRIDSSEALSQTELIKRRVDRLGIYLNDTLTLGRVALSAGARYDRTATSGDQFSPSLGITWQLTENTLLRGYTATGFSLPAFTLELGSEEVWTSQIGLESSAIPYIWLKGTLFRNDTRNITVYDQQSNSFRGEHQLRQGFEVEGRTTERYNLSLRAGYSYLEARRAADKSIVKDVPTDTIHLGLAYDDHRRFKGLLTGRYLDWNAEPYHNGSYRGGIWDLHVSSSLFVGKQGGSELFFSLRNLFNAPQYMDEIFKNNSRWVEVGVRVSF